MNAVTYGQEPPVTAIRGNYLRQNRSLRLRSSNAFGVHAFEALLTDEGAVIVEHLSQAPKAFDFLRSHHFEQLAIVDARGLPAPRLPWLTQGKINGAFIASTSEVCS